MDSKIFLRKYRVAAEEMEAVGEPGDNPRAYQGEEIDSGKTVLVEVVPAGSLKMAAREKLEAEALAARKLNHANIPALHDFGVEDDHLVYVSENFEGTLAEQWVSTNGPMPVGPVLRIASQVMSALGAAAFHRIVHRAINPSNLVLVPGQTAEGEWPLVKILHFVGSVPKFSGTDFSAAASEKTLPYASPEQLEYGAVDFRSEIYSLGGTMWFLLTGTPPPPAAQLAKTGLPVERIGAMPGRIGRLLAQMLSVNPAERPRDPLAFHRQLQDCLTEVQRREKPVRTSAVPVARTIAISGPEKRRSPLKAFARAALFLAMAALSALVLREYLRHRRVVHAEEPIGVPIGVSNASASATPVSATAADTMVSIVRQPTPVMVDANTTQSVRAKTAESDNILPAQQRTPVTANNLSTLPATIDLSRVVSTSRAETAPAQSPNAKASAEDQQTAPKKNIMHEVRRAQPADEEEKPAEPAPPAQGPDVATSGTTASPRPQPNSVAPKEQSPDPKRDAARTKSRKAKRTDPESTTLFKVPSPED